jgi:hypothetical protein
VRENALGKGRRYVAEGRLMVRSVTAESARAVCRGDGAVYQPGFEGGRWFCDCPAFGRCSHQYALGPVTSFETRKGQRMRGAGQTAQVPDQEWP